MRAYSSNRTWIGKCVAMGSLLVAACGANAIILPPGGIVPVAGITASGNPALDGAVIYDKIVPFKIHSATGQVIVQGLAEDMIIQSTITGNLDFYFRITSFPVSIEPVTVVKRKSFTGWSTDVDFRLDWPGTSGPDTALRSLSGSVITYRFTAMPIGPGTVSNWVYASTNSPVFVPGGFLTISAMHFGHLYSANVHCMQP